jgi:hypothetical protein
VSAASNKTDKPARPANPHCEECRHPTTFHDPKVGRRKRKCNAFGCDCKGLVLPKAEKKGAKR